MAYISTTGNPAGTQKREGIFAKLKAAFQRRRLYLQTVEELNSLSDRDLRDLAISRYDVRRIAKEAAYGK